MISKKFVAQALLVALLPAALSACVRAAPTAELSPGDPAPDATAAAAPKTLAMAHDPGDSSTQGPQDSAKGADSAESANEPPSEAQVQAAPANAELAQDSTLRAQVLLERAYFSPGQIDGVDGGNTSKAIVGYQRAHDMEATGDMNEAMWKALASDGAPILIEHTLTAEDVAGPFRDIPDSIEAKAKMESLPYSSAEEKLGELFHASPGLLKKLNPDADLSKAGTVITVPNVESAKTLPTPARVIVDKSDSALLIEDASGKVVGQFTVTTGSAQFPLPIGEWKINGVAMNPVWYFDPKLIAGTSKNAEKAEIPPGPNNPVGVVWIDLTKEHYGIHGTPDPARVGKNASNGCIRMTNWSAEALAKVVKPGMQVTMRE